MMKKVVLITSLCMIAGFSFAQKKAVKQAKSSIDKTAEARGYIKPALTDPETVNDAETWKVAGDIEFKSFEKEYENEMTKDLTGKGGNEEIMYTGIYNMVDYYKKADELGQLPDEKGKIKNKFRKDIVKNFRVAHPMYINAGVYYNDKGVEASRAGNEEQSKAFYSKAADYFELYWDVPLLPMFAEEKEPLMEKNPRQDSTYQSIKYYSVISAVQSGDSEKSIRLLEKIIASPYLPNDVHLESDPYELLAVEYEKKGDSINYINTLKLGAQKFPKNKYFTPNLINAFIRAGQGTEAMNYLDQAIKNDPSSKCELLSVKGSLFATDLKYDDAVNAYKEALNADENCERALEGLGVLYVLQAQDLKEKAGQETNRQKIKELDAETVELYQLSLPLLEKFVASMKARGADSMDLRPGLVKLQNVYYNLSLLGVSKESELDAIEAEINAL